MQTKLEKRLKIFTEIEQYHEINLKVSCFATLQNIVAISLCNDVCLRSIVHALFTFKFISPENLKHETLPNPLKK